LGKPQKKVSVHRFRVQRSRFGKELVADSS
jgi:hypothetical protein